MTGAVAGSALSVASSASPTFSASLDNGDASPTYAVTLLTQDTSGTGAGWNETLTSTQFTTSAPGNHVLAATASTVVGVAAADATGTDTPPSNLIAYPVAVPAGLSAPDPVKIFDAATDTGMGRFTITPTVAVFVPQDSYSGTYASTLTLAIVSGP